MIPTIDARRMEVYMQMFDYKLHPISEPSAVVIDEQYFSNFAKDKNTIGVALVLKNCLLFSLKITK